MPISTLERLPAEIISKITGLVRDHCSLRELARIYPTLVPIVDAQIGYFILHESGFNFDNPSSNELRFEEWFNESIKVAKDPAGQPTSNVHHFTVPWNSFSSFSDIYNYMGVDGNGTKSLLQWFDWIVANQEKYEHMLFIVDNPHTSVLIDLLTIFEYLFVFRDKGSKAFITSFSMISVRFEDPGMKTADSEFFKDETRRLFLDKYHSTRLTARKDTNELIYKFSCGYYNNPSSFYRYINEEILSSFKNLKYEHSTDPSLDITEVYGIPIRELKMEDVPNFISFDTVLVRDTRDKYPPQKPALNFSTLLPRSLFTSFPHFNISRLPTPPPETEESVYDYSFQNFAQLACYYSRHSKQVKAFRNSIAYHDSSYRIQIPILQDDQDYELLSTSFDRSKRGHNFLYELPWLKHDIFQIRLNLFTANK